MTDFLIVKEDPTLVREMGSKAILQTDTRRREEHMNRKRALKATIKRSEQMGEKINTLEARIAALEQIIVGLTGN